MIAQTFEIPADRRIIVDVPHEIEGESVVLTFTPAASANPCPICTKNINPETGNPRFNAETIAAIEEGRTMMRGEIPAKRFNSLDEMWDDLMNDDTAE